MIKKILKLIFKKNLITQREISEYLDISLGSVNKNIKMALLKELILVERISYRESKYILTPKGKDFLNQQENTSLAIILLAGKVKSLDRSLGEVFLEDKTLVERHIWILEKNKIEKIIFVVEEKNEYYSNLENKYKNIQFIENKLYKKTGNMYSLYLTRSRIQEDFLLLDGDLVYESDIIDEILKNTKKNITVIDKNIDERDDILYVDTKENRLKNLSKDRLSLQNISGQLMGISKIEYKSYLKMIGKFTKINNSMYFYEYFFSDKEIFEEFYTLEKNNIIWGEIDNLKQYKYLLKYILPKLREEE
ncbi:winged helix-turn-helix transcriptional regulator [Cetobacterium sp.]|uniref:winged helix-turn-helix transcriptional regulator n=1 Tax=Cetobacterium sp. TaxID=2071632 RepID=UPI003EE6002E